MNTDGSIDIHANFLPSIHATIPPAPVFRTNPSTPSRSYHRLALFRQGLGTVYRMFSGQWDHAGFLGWAIQRVFI